MKNQTIIRSKLWNDLQTGKPSIFPYEFYSQLDILKALNHFDFMNVEAKLTHGKTSKGFGAFIVELKR